MPPLLEIRDLCWVPPGGDEPLWRDVAFRVEPNELVVLTGPSGAGKSSLLRCIVGLESESEGQVLWRDREVTHDNIREFRHRVVYVHQSPVPISPHIGDNLAFPRSISSEFPHYAHEVLDEEAQRRLLGRFGLEELDFSRRFDELSVGEQQRVALVRCLTVQPDVLLLDEPTASVDEDTARIIEDYVTEYVRDGSEHAAVWISHDREQRARLEGRVLDLERWLV